MRMGAADAMMKTRVGTTPTLAGPRVARAQALHADVHTLLGGGRSPHHNHVMLTTANARPRASTSVSCRASASSGHAPADVRSPAAALDVVGLGQAMVDYAGWVSDAFLADLLAEVSPTARKGDRVVVGREAMGRVLNKIDSSDFKVQTGGSLSNSLVALSRLGLGSRSHTRGGEHLQVGMAGLVGGDPVGEFYRAKMHKAGVRFLSEPSVGDAHGADATTGTVIVLTTPDAQRTMLSHFPAEAPPAASPSDKGAPPSEQEARVLTPAALEAIQHARVLVVEGYMLECGLSATRCVDRAIAHARNHGTMVCLTLCDTSVVAQHAPALARMAQRDADVVFANANEALSLVAEAGEGQHQPEDARAACSGLAGMSRGVAVVTDGHRGSFLAGMGEVVDVPPFWTQGRPLDTCGAGDAYAAGCMYGLLRGAPLRGMGQAGARVASTVIHQRGARLKMEDAQRLSQVLPAFMFDDSFMVNLPAKGAEGAQAPLL